MTRLTAVVAVLCAGMTETGGLIAGVLTARVMSGPSAPRKRCNARSIDAVPQISNLSRPQRAPPRDAALSRCVDRFAVGAARRNQSTGSRLSASRTCGRAGFRHHSQMQADSSSFSGAAPRLLSPSVHHCRLGATYGPSVVDYAFAPRLEPSRRKTRPT